MSPSHRIALGLAAALLLPPAISGAAAEGPRLGFPLACAIGRTCEVQNYVNHDPGTGRKDYRCGAHTYGRHDAIDIRLLDMAAQRAGVDVLAAAAGKVVAVRDGVADVSVKVGGPASVAGRECGNRVAIAHGDGWLTDYCHLALGSLKVKPGDQVQAGQPIARVGLSGDTEYPHLHMSLRQGTRLVDPFAPQLAAAACDATTSATAGMWSPAAASALSYQRGVVLNAGFAGGSVTMDGLEQANLVAATLGAPVLVAYVRTLNLEKGDTQEIVLRDPTGAVRRTFSIPALEGPMAQYLISAGLKRPEAGWMRGAYTATYTLTRDGAVALSRQIRLAL